MTTPAPSPPKPRAAGYVRVSSAKQAESDKTSLQEQASAIEAYCEKAGFELIETFQDVESGTSRKRPSWCRMLRGAEAGAFEHIVCWSSDRLARGGAPMGDLLDAAPASKVTIHTCNSTFDRRYAELLSSIARLERDAFQERAQTGRRGRAKAGRLPVARAPFGYLVGRSDDGKPTGLLVEDPITAATVRRIFGLAAGPQGVGTRTIASTLNREGVESPNGDHWWPGAISRILANKAYIGNYLYGTRRGRGRTNDDAIEVAIPALVDAGLWASAQREASKRAAGFQRRKHTYSLSGILSCGVCERTMSGTARITNHGKPLETPRRFYRCAIGRDSRRPDCRPTAHQLAVDIEAVVWDAVKKMLEDPFSFCDADAFNEDGPADDDNLDAEIRDAERTLKALDLEDERLLTAYVKGLFKAEHLESAKSGIDARRATAQVHLSGLEGRRVLRVDRSTVGLSIRAIQDAIDFDLDALDDAGRKGLVQQCVEAVELDASGHVRIGFNFVKVDSEAELAALRVAPRLTLQVV